MVNAIQIIERRAKPRIETKVKVKVLGESGLFETYSGNLSKSGVFLETQEPFGEIGGKVQMQLLLPNSAEAVRVSGKIMRIVGPNRVKYASGVAVHFLKVETRQAKTFDKLIDRLLDARGIGCRKYPRVKTQVLVELKTKNDIRQAIADNLSKGGLFLKMPVNGLVLGDTLNIVLIHPTAKRKFLIDGEIVHIRKGESNVREDFVEGVGVQFSEVSSARRSDMALFLRSIMAAKKRVTKE